MARPEVWWRSEAGDEAGLMSAEEATRLDTAGMATEPVAAGMATEPHVVGGEGTVRRRIC